MKINHNMSAVITNAQLLHSENSLSETMERLSSGFKINHAKDDPAGMAISDKMQAQIDGLAKASQNASNGNSVLQIADTAVGEMTSILQRMRELSVQAANDTNTLEDREVMQEEIAELRKEVDRISRDTEYNTKKLLDGSSDARVYTHSDISAPIEITRMSVTEAVEPGIYTMKISGTGAATQGTTVTKTDESPVTDKRLTEGSITVNGYEIKFTGEETEQEFFEKLRDGAAKGNVNVFVVDNTATPNLQEYPATGGYTPKTVQVTDENGDPVQAKDEEGNLLTDEDNNPIYEYEYATFQFNENLAFVCNEFGNKSEVTVTCSTPEYEELLGIKNPVATSTGTNIDISIEPSDFGPQATVLLSLESY